MEGIMKNLTTPKAILCGLGLVALAIASIPYSSKVITPAYASNGVQKIAICDSVGFNCADILMNKRKGSRELRVYARGRQKREME